MTAEKSWIERAAQVADEVLAPQARTVDQDGEIPRAHFDRLAEAGFYGVALQDDLDPATFTEAAEILIAGCLATAFVWAQHHGVARRVSGSPNHELRERLTAELRDGRIRAGVSYAGAAEPPSLVARRTAGGYLLEGTAPFVSGWGMVDLVGVMARDSADEGALVSVVVPAVEGPQLRVRQIPLVAANASRTVTATFDELFVPDADVDTLVPLQKFHDSAAIAVWRNGSLPLGLVRRCVAELETLGADHEALREAAVHIRKELDAGLFGQTDLFVARARASELALRAAAALMTATGSRGIVTGSTAERTLREATFTLVFGSRPPIKTALFDHLTGTAGQP